MLIHLFELLYPQKMWITLHKNNATGPGKPWFLHPKKKADKMHNMINRIKKKKSSKIVRGTKGAVEIALIFGIIALVIQQWGLAVERIG